MTRRPAVVVTSTEWRSLLALDELRLARRRVTPVTSPPRRRERDRLFCVAPTTVLGDANDVIVLELDPDRWSHVAREPAYRAEIAIICRADVSAHHCVDSAQFAYLSEEARREGLVMRTGHYDAAWRAWVLQEQDRLRLQAATTVLNCFGLTIDARKRRSDGSKWRDVLRVAESADQLLPRQPRHVLQLLHHLRQLENETAAIRDTAAYPLAAVVEWTRLRTRRDPLKNKSLRALIRPTIADAKQHPFTIECLRETGTTEICRRLSEAYPKAFTQELQPEAIVLILRFVKDAKDGLLRPHEFRAAVTHLAETSHDGATLLSASTAAALGAPTARRLANALQSAETR